VDRDVPHPADDDLAVAATRRAPQISVEAEDGDLGMVDERR
jgi:hypothetical protein